MRQRLKEEFVIFASVAKWLVLGALVGCITGFSTTALVTALNRGAELYAWGRHYWLMPLGLVASAIVIEYLPSARGHGADKVIEAVHRHSGKLKPIYVPIEFIRTFITLTAGASAGKEGPSAQIGGGLASFLADALGFEGIDRKKLVICGIGGGFASVFGTPIAGAIFGLEVLFIGVIRYEALLPSIVAGTVSYQVSTWLGLAYFHRPLAFVPAFSEVFFLKVVAAGVFFGLVSVAFIEILSFFRTLGERISLSFWVKALGAGIVMAAATEVVGRHYLGLGLDTIQLALEGKDSPPLAFLLKSVFTGVTLGFGGHGGVGTPIFYVGATAGSAFSRIIGGDPAMFAALGFASLLAGAANTPIAASIMAVELFGAPVAPYAAMSSVISFVISGHRSAYASQVTAVGKSASLDVQTGTRVREADPRVMVREKTVTGLPGGLPGWLGRFLERKKRGG